MMPVALRIRRCSDVALLRQPDLFDDIAAHAGVASGKQLQNGDACQMRKRFRHRHNSRVFIDGRFAPDTRGGHHMQTLYR